MTCFLLIAFNTQAFFSSAAKAECYQAYETKLINQEVNRARVIAIAVALGDLALLPILPVSGEIILGGTAIAVGGTTYIIDELDKHQKLLPQGLKEYIVLNSVMNGAAPIDIEKKANVWLFGRRAKFHYRIPTDEQANVMDDFTDSIQQDVADRCFKEITVTDVNAAVASLMQNDQLCTTGKGKHKALTMNKFKTQIALEICKGASTSAQF